MEKLRNLFVRGAVFGTIVVMVSSCGPKEERLMPGMKAYGENPTFTLWMSSVDDSHAAADTADFTDHVIDSVPTQQNDTVPCDCDTVVEPKKPCDCDTVAEQRCCPTINNNNGILIIGNNNNNNTINQNQTTVTTNGNNNQTTVNSTAGGNTSNNVNTRRNTDRTQQTDGGRQNRQTNPCPCETVESRTRMHVSVRGSVTVTQQPAQQQPQSNTTYYYYSNSYSK